MADPHAEQLQAAPPLVHGLTGDAAQHAANLSNRKQAAGLDGQPFPFRSPPRPGVGQWVEKTGSCEAGGVAERARDSAEVGGRRQGFAKGLDGG